jgi:hypothetical protein
MLVRIGPYRKNRKLQVVIHRYDTWNMDSTLAHITVPMLKQLKKITHGIPGSVLSPEYNRLTSFKKYWKEPKNGPLHKKERKLGTCPGQLFGEWGHLPFRYTMGK